MPDSNITSIIDVPTANVDNVQPLTLLRQSPIYRISYMRAKMILIQFLRLESFIFTSVDCNDTC